MTNEQIIFSESQRLAEAGTIRYTGRVFQAVDKAGQEITIRETEPIHTFAAWQQLGFRVRKGQKAISKITIWKRAVKVDEETGEQQARMFMKTAAFFAASQVEPLEEAAPQPAVFTPEAFASIASA